MADANPPAADERGRDSGPSSAKDRSKSKKAAALEKAREKKEQKQRELQRTQALEKCEEARRFLEPEGRNAQPNHSKALAAIAEAIELDPSNSQPYYWQGCTFRDQGKFEDAIASFSMCVEHNPAEVKALECRAFCFETLKQWRKAIEDYSAILAIDPKNDHAFNMRGLCRLYLRVPGLRLKKDEFAVVIKEFKSALHINPSNYYAWANLGKAYEDQGLLREALSAYSAAIDIKTDYRYAIFRRGCVALAVAEGVLAEENSSAKAAGDQTVASEKNATAKTVSELTTRQLANAGESALRQNECSALLQSASNDFRSLLTDDDSTSNDPISLIHFGTCYMYQGDLTKAETQFKRAAEVSAAHLAALDDVADDESGEKKQLGLSNHQLITHLLGVRNEELSAMRSKRFLS